MLEKFGIGVFSEYLSEEEKVIAIRGFIEFYYDQTPKHQRRIRLEWLSSDKHTLEEDLLLLKQYDVNVDSIVNVYTPQEKESFYQNTHIVLHPTQKNCKQVISDSFAASTPVICTNCEFTKDHIDMSCGIILGGRSQEQYVCEIAEVLDMLYHDSGVVKILGRGAYEQYEDKFAWGLRQFRKQSHR